MIAGYRPELESTAAAREATRFMLLNPPVPLAAAPRLRPDRRRRRGAAADLGKALAAAAGPRTGHRSGLACRRAVDGTRAVGDGRARGPSPGGPDRRRPPREQPLASPGHATWSAQPRRDRVGRVRERRPRRRWRPPPTQAGTTPSRSRRGTRRRSPTRSCGRRCTPTSRSPPRRRSPLSRSRVCPRGRRSCAGTGDQPRPEHGLERAVLAGPPTLAVRRLVRATHHAEPRARPSAAARSTRRCTTRSRRTPPGAPSRRRSTRTSPAATDRFGSGRDRIGSDRIGIVRDVRHPDTPILACQTSRTIRVGPVAQVSRLISKV